MRRLAKELAVAALFSFVDEAAKAAARYVEKRFLGSGEEDSGNSEGVAGVEETGSGAQHAAEHGPARRGRR